MARSLKLDAKLLQFKNHNNMNNDELEEAVEDAWERIEVEELDIEGYDNLEDDEKWLVKKERVIEWVRNGLWLDKYADLEFQDYLRTKLRQSYLGKHNATECPLCKHQIDV